MKYIYLFTLSVVILFFSVDLFSQYDKPDGIAYSEKTNSYYVANIGPSESCNATTTQAMVLKIDTLGNTYPHSTVNGMTDLAIVGDTIYGVFMCSVIRCDLNSSQVFGTDYFFNNSDYFNLNSVCYDGGNYLYMSEGKSYKLYRYDIRTRQLEMFNTMDSIRGPSDMIFDADNNRLIILSNWKNSMRASNIVAVDIESREVTMLMETSLYKLEGITEGPDAYYIASWDNGGEFSGKIYKVNFDFSGRPEIFRPGYAQPCDILYNPADGKLAIPNQLTNTVDFIQLVDIEKIPKLLPIGKEGEPVSTTPVLNWTNTGADYYILQLAAKTNSNLLGDKDFDDPIIEKYEIHDTTYTVETELADNSDYVWRVRAVHGNDVSPWSRIMEFTTGKPNSVEFAIMSSDIQIYPNPASDYLNIKCDTDSANAVNVEILNTIGQSIRNYQKINSGVFDEKIDISDLNPGVYFVKITSAGRQMIESFVVGR